MTDATALRSAEPLDLADVEARIERHRCHVNAPHPTEAGAADLSRLIDHDAPALAAALRRVKVLHSEYRIYDECGHRHTEADPFVRDVSHIGLVCEEGYLYSICRHCCTDTCGDQTEECISSHTHANSICPTRDALAGPETATVDTAQVTS